MPFLKYTLKSSALVYVILTTAALTGCNNRCRLSRRRSCRALCQLTEDRVFHTFYQEYCNNTLVLIPTYSKRNTFKFSNLNSIPISQPLLHSLCPSTSPYSFLMFLPYSMGRAVAYWLRHYATNRQVAGSVPDGVIGIFQWHKPSCRPLALGSKWVPGVFPGGKGGRCVRLTTLPPSYAVVMKSGKLNFLKPSGPLQACNGTALRFTIFDEVWKLDSY